MNYITRVSNPSAYKDMITSITYPFEIGNEASREAAYDQAVAAQNAVVVSLGIPAKNDGDLVNLKLAYALSQE